MPLHELVQHSLGLLHGEPFAPQVEAPHVPEALQLWVQHSPAVEQGTPSLLQVCGAAQNPPGQEPAQHSAPEMQAVPLPLHAAAPGVVEFPLQPDTATARANTSPTIQGRVRVGMVAIFRHPRLGPQVEFYFWLPHLHHIPPRPNVDDPPCA